MDALSDGDTQRSIVSHLRKRSLISAKVWAQQMTSTQERGRSLLTVLDLEEKPHKLRELITVMMEVEKVKPLAEKMTAQLSKSVQGNSHTVCACVCLHVYSMQCVHAYLCACVHVCVWVHVCMCV